MATFDGQSVRLCVNGGQVGSRLAPGVVGPAAEFSTVEAGEDGRNPSCVTIAHGSTYSPGLEDLGCTLKATTTNPGHQSITGWDRTPVIDTLLDNGVSKGIVNDLSEGQAINGPFPVTAALYGMPAGRVSFEVDGELGYAKVGEAPYQYLWNTTRVPNGPNTVSVTAKSPIGTGSTRTQVVVNVEN